MGPLRNELVLMKWHYQQRGTDNSPLGDGANAATYMQGEKKQGCGKDGRGDTV